MHEYAVTIATSARKEIEKLPDEFIEKIIVKIEALSVDPRPAGCKKLKGEENLWRIRVGDYRVTYYIYDRRHLVDVMGVRHRKDAYR